MTDLNRRFLLISGLATALISGSALADSGKNQFSGLITPTNFNAADKARIQKATAYLQGLSAGQGRFEQTDFRGRVTQGNWFLQRPGKIRFEYDPPYSLLIVSDGTRVKMWDPRLKSFDQYPLSETPLSLFLSKQIRFDEGVIVTQITSNNQGFILKARDRRRQVEGSVSLVFDQSANGSISLREWTVTDAQNRPTRVHLTTFVYATNLKPDLFVLNKPQINK